MICMQGPASEKTPVSRAVARLTGHDFDVARATACPVLADGASLTLLSLSLVCRPSPIHSLPQQPPACPHIPCI
jgi:hypothetical protein